MKTALDYLDDLKDDAAVHIWPDDLAKCQTSECVVEVASVRLGSPDGKTVPLFSREQVAAALQWAASQQSDIKSELCRKLVAVSDAVVAQDDRVVQELVGEMLRMLGDETAIFLAASQQAAEGWISVHDRLPILPEDCEDDGVKVYTWDGEFVTEDVFEPQYEQPAGPAVGGWIRTGDWFCSDTAARVTHWMLRILPSPPSTQGGADADQA